MVKVGTHFSLSFITLAVIIISASFFIRIIAKTLLKISVTLSEEGEFESQRGKIDSFTWHCESKSVYRMVQGVTPQKYIMARKVFTIN